MSNAIISNNNPYASCRLNSSKEFDYSDDRYIAPCKDTVPKYQYLSKYALNHRAGFKGFWVAPFVILQKGRASAHIEYSVYVIPEIDHLLKHGGKIFDMDFARIIRLIQYGHYKLKPVGSVEIYNLVLNPVDFSDKQQETTVLNVMKQLGQEHGMNFQTMEELS